MARPRKRDEDKFETPVRSHRVYPPENWDALEVIAKAHGETRAARLNRLIAEDVRRNRHLLR